MAQSLFDLKHKKMQLTRAASRAPQRDAWFLHHQICEEMSERLLPLNLSFERVLVLRDLGFDWQAAVPEKLARAKLDVVELPLDGILDVEPESYDLVLAPLALHWVEDLPQLLLRSRFALRSNGMFLGSLFGGESLIELRQCLAQAEEELCGGVSQRFSPSIDLRAAAGLMQSAGFALPVADVDRVDLKYAEPQKLLRDLSASGESNAILARPRGFASRALLSRTSQLYRQRFADDQGHVPVTCEVIHLSGSAL